MTTPETILLALSQHDSAAANALEQADRSMKQRVPITLMGHDFQVTSIGKESGMVVIRGVPFEAV